MNKSVLPLYIDVFAGLQPMWNLLIFLEASNLLNFTIDNTFSQWNWLTQFKSSWSVMNMADWCWLLPIFLSILSNMCHCYANVFMFIRGHQGSVAWRWNQGNWLVYCNLCVGIRSSQLSCWQLGLPCFRSGTCHRKTCEKWWVATLSHCINAGIFLLVCCYHSILHCRTTSESWQGPQNWEHLTEACWCHVCLERHRQIMCVW